VKRAKEDLREKERTDSKSEKQARFSNGGISDNQKFKQVIAEIKSKSKSKSKSNNQSYSHSVDVDSTNKTYYSLLLILNSSIQTLFFPNSPLNPPLNTFSFHTFNLTLTQHCLLSFLFIIIPFLFLFF